MTTLLAAEIVGSLLVVLSVYLAGRKSLWSPACSVLAFVPFAFFGIANGAWVFVGLQAILAGLGVRNFLLWRSSRT